MNTNSTLIRESDQVRFSVTLLSHWSDIQSESGEKDSVKWAFDTRYVGQSGEMYILTNKFKVKAFS